VTRQVKGYNHTPANIKKRSMRNQARAEMRKELGESAIRGKDIDHKRPVRSGGSNARSNLRVRDRHTNRGWERE